MKTLISTIVFLFAASLCWAVSGSYSADGVTLNWTTSGTGTYSVSGTWVQVAASNKGGGIHKDPWPGSWTRQFGNGNTSGSWSITGLTADQPMFLIMYTDIPPVTETHRSSFTITNTVAVTTKGATIQIPANGTRFRILYLIKQDGVVKASYTSEPGDAATTVYVGSLTNDHQLTLEQVTGGDVIVPTDSEGNPDYNAPVNQADNTETVVVGTVTPNGETAPGSGATANTGATTAPTPIAPGVPPPSPVAPPAAPTSTTTPAAPSTTVNITATTHPTLPTPTGTGGATKEDIMTGSNQVTAAVNDVSNQVVATGNNVVSATDKVAGAVSANSTAVVTAVDKTSTAVWESGKKTIESIGKTNVALEVVNTSLAGVKTAVLSVKTSVDGVSAKIDTTNTRLSEIKTAIESGPDRTADTAAASASYATAQTSGASSNTSAQGSINAFDVPTIAPTSPGSQSLEIDVPGVATFSLDPSSDPVVSLVIEWIRAFMAWCIVLAFWWWLWAEFKQLMGLAMLLPQAKGNTVAAGTGGQATALIAAGAISVFLLGVPAAFFAVNTFGAGMDANPFSGASGPVAVALYLLYMFFPVEVLVSALVAAFAVRKGGIVILTGVAALIRFVIP